MRTKDLPQDVKDLRETKILIISKLKRQIILYHLMIGIIIKGKKQNFLHKKILINTKKFSLKIKKIKI